MRLNDVEGQFIQRMTKKEDNSLEIENYKFEIK